jgi:hypothetical protein
LHSIFCSLLLSPPSWQWYHTIPLSMVTTTDGGRPYTNTAICGATSSNNTLYHHRMVCYHHTQTSPTTDNLTFSKHNGLFLLQTGSC